MARPTPRQPSLFESEGRRDGVDPPGQDREGTSAASALPLRRDQLLAWQERVLAHQSPLFAPLAGQDPDQPAQPGASVASERQGNLFNNPSSRSANALADDCNPLRLTPLALDFWRWPNPPHRGASLYFVLDRPAGQPLPLLLYVGETGQADRRWKGDHDCKGYLAAYVEALRHVGLTPMLSIRFWCDVPSPARQRRQLEQALIRRWLPPFNKETRGRWATPFTADPD